MHTIRLPVLRWGFLASALTLTACDGCGGQDEVTLAESQRLWGREKIADAVVQRARQPIKAEKLDQNPNARSRVLNMPIEEVIARVGFLRYSGQARFSLERNGRSMTVFEDTLIEHGLNGGWRVLQRDESGVVLREKVYSNGLYYVRNGPGQLRLRGVADTPGDLTRGEAFSPLSSFTAWFGARLTLKKVGRARASGLPAVKYRFALGAGPSTVSDPNRPEKKLRPARLSGYLLAELETGAPLEGELKGQLDVEPPAEGSEWGRLELDLRFQLVPTDGPPIVVGEHVPPIRRRAVDLEPLGFLKGETRTSTVIGGRKRARRP